MTSGEEKENKELGICRHYQMTFPDKETKSKKIPWKNTIINRIKNLTDKISEKDIKF